MGVRLDIPGISAAAGDSGRKRRRISVHEESESCTYIPVRSHEESIGMTGEALSESLAFLNTRPAGQNTRKCPDLTFRLEAIGLD